MAKTHKGMVHLGAGLPGLLKSGYEHFSGVEEAVMRNIEACTQLSNKTKTSLGPNGMNKLVINHLEKVLVTSDAAVMCTELEVIHPAAKIIVMAVKQQESACGDGTNFVVSFCGELMAKAGDLIRTGLHISEIIAGYEAAYEKSKDILGSLVVKTVDTPSDRKSLINILKPVLGSKQYGHEDLLAPLVADASISVLGKGKVMKVDNVRVAKLIGATLQDSSVVQGVVITRNTMGSVKRVAKAKIAVYAQAVEASSTEAKGNVLIKSASELMNYNKSEEAMIETRIRDIAEAGINVIVSGGKISEMALHFIEKYNMMAIKIMSKFELRRICRVTGACAQVKLKPPIPEDVGSCDLVEVREFGSKHCIVMQQTEDASRLTTIVLRGSTSNILDDFERAIDDGVNTVKTICNDGRLVPGAGSTEIEMAKQIKAYANTCPGLEQYAIKKFGEALEVVPKILAENSGQLATEVLSQLYAAHANGDAGVGVNVSGKGVVDATKEEILDSFKTKSMALELAMEAALTILRVDQIIMAKRAGGPKPGGPGGHWDDTDNM